MKKRLFAVLACCLALLMVLTACGTEQTDPTPAGTEPPAENTGSAEAEPVTITYCNFNASGGNEETLQRMYEAFHEEYPNITVEIETIAMDDYFTQLQTRIVGGTAPRLLRDEYRELRRLRQHGRPGSDRGCGYKRHGRDRALRLHC